MEILNPSSKVIEKYNGKNQEFISFVKNEMGLFFSKTAMKRFVLQPETRLTFVIDVDRLYFYISKKKNDGFVLKAYRHDSGLICSKMLVRYIYNRLPLVKRNGPRFQFKLSPVQINDCITFEILIHQKI